MPLPAFAFMPVNDRLGAFHAPHMQGAKRPTGMIGGGFAPPIVSFHARYRQTWSAPRTTHANRLLRILFRNNTCSPTQAVENTTPWQKTLRVLCFWAFVRTIEFTRKFISPIMARSAQKKRSCWGSFCHGVLTQGLGIHRKVGFAKPF